MMQAETIFYVILWFLIGEFLLMKYIGYLNTTNWSDVIPSELKGIYDAKKYKESQKYEKEKYSFGIISSTFSFILLIIALLFWFFWALDAYVRDIVSSELWVSLMFFFVLMVLQMLINIPFDYYATFNIEEKFWFNKSTKKLFFIDMCKWLFLTILMWGILLSIIISLYNTLWEYFWIWAWAIMTAFSIFMMAFYSSIIVPLFNKQTLLEDGELKDAIKAFSKKVGFKLDNIYVIDGSKRSSKANAYFSGFWKKKRIVLYDTLIHDLTTDEIVSVLAHEIGHSKKRHTIQMLIFSIVQTWFLLYILSLSLSIPVISYALWAVTPSFHMGVLAFSILFTPISIVLGVLWNILSRKNEYEADAYASHYYWPEALQSALKKLSVSNLSNLNPHPVYEFFHYSHPTVLKRLKAMENFKK